MYDIQNKDDTRRNWGEEIEMTRLRIGHSNLNSTV